MVNRTLLTLFLTLVSSAAIFVVRSNALPKTEKIQIFGTVISYNVFSRLTIIIGQVPKNIEDHTMMIVKVDKADRDLEKGQFIMVRFTNADNPEVHLPIVMLEETQQWQFSLIRDNACDESAEDVLYTKGENGKEPNRSWKRLVGAEKEKIPEGANLPCFVFGANDFKK